jgi:hypothetical protein
MLSKDDIATINRFIKKTKCSMNMARVEGYSLSSTTWNLTSRNRRWIITPAASRLREGDPRKALCPFSMMLVGRSYRDAIGKWHQVEQINQLPDLFVRRGVYGGLALSNDLRNLIMDGPDRERLILAYNIGIHLRNTIVGETPLHFLTRIPDGISLYG